MRKHDVRVEAYGAVDELNALIGVVRANLAEPDLDGWLALIQSALFDLGGELATPDFEERVTKGQKLPRVSGDEVAEFERWIDVLEEELDPLTTFILPGGAQAAAQLHHARTVCRRAERRAVELAEHEPVSPGALRYLNRLSDLLFVMARAVNRRASVEEPPWIGRER